MLNILEQNKIKKCKICGFIAKKVESISQHITKTHKNTLKEYYDKFFRTQKDGICIVCSNNTKFNSIGRGYNKTCSRKCLSSYAGTISSKTGGKNNWRKGLKGWIKKSKNNTYARMYGIVEGKRKCQLLSLAHIGIKPSKKTREIQSLLMKKKIQEGSFTFR